MGSDSTSDDTDEFIAWMVMSDALPCVGNDVKWDGEQDIRRRKSNKSRSFPNARKTFNKFYFKKDSVYNEPDFESRFRKSREVFERLCKRMRRRGIFVQSCVVFRRHGIDP